jgi:hypothetical protein
VIERGDNCCWPVVWHLDTPTASNTSTRTPLCPQSKTNYERKRKRKKGKLVHAAQNKMNSDIDFNKLIKDKQKKWESANNSKNFLWFWTREVKCFGSECHKNCSTAKAEKCQWKLIHCSGICTYTGNLLC